MHTEMEKSHQQKKKDFNIRRRKHDELNNVERARKFEATSKACPGKIPLKLSGCKISLQKSLGKTKAKESWSKRNFV